MANKFDIFVKKNNVNKIRKIFFVNYVYIIQLIIKQSMNINYTQFEIKMFQFK